MGVPLRVRLVLWILMLVGGCANIEPVPYPQVTVPAAPISEPRQAPADPPVMADAPRPPAAEAVVHPVDLPAEAVIHIVPLAPIDIWERMRHGFVMADLEGDPVLQREYAHLTGRPDLALRMLQRARPFLALIVAELERRRLPTELALVPLVESGFNPAAFSPAAAAGLWQFISPTARRFGLSQGWMLDSRGNVFAATRAALDYLQALHTMHGDWHLALASYNWGENAVSRVVRSSLAAGQSGVFGELRLPRETRTYVPRILAWKKFIATPPAGATLPDIGNEPQIVELAINRNLGVEAAAAMARLSPAQFRQLNPGFLRPVIPLLADGQAHLVLPAENARYFEHAWNQRRHPLSAGWRLVAIAHPERLDALARRHGMTASLLRAANGFDARAKAIVSGSRILVPARAGRHEEPIFADTPPPVAIDRFPVRLVQLPGKPARVHVADRGESLRSIARARRIPLKKLARLNRHGVDARLSAGTQVVVAAAVAPRTQRIPVEIGEVPPGARRLAPGQSLGTVRA